MQPPSCDKILFLILKKWIGMNYAQSYKVLGVATSMSLSILVVNIDCLPVGCST